MNRLLPFLLTLALTPAALAEDKFTHKDWETDFALDGWVRYITHGTAVWGHEFGFMSPTADCLHENFWLTWSTYEKGLDAYVGQDVTFELKVDGEPYYVAVPLLRADPFIGKMTLAMFTNYSVTPQLKRALLAGNRVEVKIVAPEAVVAKFDIPFEEFSLSGMTANATKALDVCSNGPSAF